VLDWTTCASSYHPQPSSADSMKCGNQLARHDSPICVIAAAITMCQELHSKQGSRTAKGARWSLRIATTSIHCGQTVDTRIRFTAAVQRCNVVQHTMLLLRPARHAASVYLSEIVVSMLSLMYLLLNYTCEDLTTCSNAAAISRSRLLTDSLLRLCRRSPVSVCVMRKRC
jgi:hypothetical protein